MPECAVPAANVARRRWKHREDGLRTVRRTIVGEVNDGLSHHSQERQPAKAAGHGAMSLNPDWGDT
jgi:hypothetical protein